MSRYALTLALAAALSLLVGADFNSAVAAYENKQFEAAYTEFRRLAELGDAPSQRNLAAMYARGEHIDKNPIDAWAWAALAAEQDNEHAPVLRDAIAKRLDDPGKLQATARLTELRAQFGVDAVNARLLPVVTDRDADCTVAGESPATPLKTRPPRYPVPALRAGASGYVCLKFYIDRQGTPLRIRSDESGVRGAEDASATARKLLPLFEQASTDAVKRWQFLPPANESLREMQARYCLDYVIAGGSNAIQAEEPKVTKAKLLALTPLAEAGDGKAQYDLASVLKDELIPGKNRRDEINRYSEQLFLQSAVNGDARGQYKLASKLLTGDRCEKDTKKAIFWLTVAAQQGNAEAAWLLSQKLDDGEDVARQKEKSVKWLRVAADGGHKRAQLQYALELLERDPGNAIEARAYLPPFVDTDDIALLEVYARLAALSGDFDSATRYQEQVVSIAAELTFALTKREQTLAAYRSKTLPATATL